MYIFHSFCFNFINRQKKMILNIKSTTKQSGSCIDHWEVSNGQNTDNLSAPYTFQCCNFKKIYLWYLLNAFEFLYIYKYRIKNSKQNSSLVLFFFKINYYIYIDSTTKKNVNNHQYSNGDSNAWFVQNNSKIQNRYCFVYWFLFSKFYFVCMQKKVNISCKTVQAYLCHSFAKHLCYLNATVLFYDWSCWSI